MLVISEGNLFNYKHQAYAQGVNTLGVMSSGIAVDFRKKYPKMFNDYQNLCAHRILLPGKLHVYKTENIYKSEKDFPEYIFNLAIQNVLFSAKKEFLVESMNRMYNFSRSNNVSDIAMPKIGCGKGQLTMDDLMSALKPFTNDMNFRVTIYEI
jgi:O-acetyl-ADP-ribose deacetylase (regulator of RNase III)